MIATLLTYKARVDRMTEEAKFTGLYVKTLKDWNGYDWNARLECVDETGAALLYTTARGPLWFRRR